MHPGWLSVKESWLPEELPLLHELSGSSSHTTTSSSFEQHLQQQQQDWTATSSTPSLPPTGPWLDALGPSPAADEDELSAGEPQHSPARMRPAPQVDLTPLGDYLGALRYTLSRPPYEGAAAMTMEGFRDYYEGMCRELALNLALAVQQGPPEDDVCSCGEHPLAALQRLELRHAHLICTLLLLHPDDLVNQIRVADLNTLQLTVDPDKVGCLQQQHPTLQHPLLLHSCPQQTLLKQHTASQNASSPGGAGAVEAWAAAASCPAPEAQP